MEGKKGKFKVVIVILILIILLLAFLVYKDIQTTNKILYHGINSLQSQSSRFMEMEKDEESYQKAMDDCWLSMVRDIAIITEISENKIFYKKYYIKDLDLALDKGRGEDFSQYPKYENLVKTVYEELSMMEDVNLHYNFISDKENVAKAIEKIDQEAKVLVEENK